MRNSLFIIVLSAFQALAGGTYAQTTRLTLDLKNSTVKEVLQKIEQQSEFYFLYNSELIDVQRKVDVSVENEKIDDVLARLFNSEKVNIVVRDRHIVLTPAGEIASQQQGKVTGKVTDTSGGSLPGVSVAIKGTTTGTITDINGMFTLTNVSPKSTLVFSFVGMKTQEFIVGDKTEFKIVLEDETIGVDEVIVIGYGTASRKDFSGSVSSVKMENSAVSLMPNMNALESLKGNVAGLNIGATNSAGGQPSMQIRGQRSINGDNNPLIILDGVIYMGSINDINPNDIASVDVLKDAVSASVYGSRSANGVIAITTKRGISQKPLITFNTSAGIQSWYNEPVMMNGTDWIKVVNARNQYTEGSTDWMKAGMLANLAAGKETNWLNKAIRTGMVQDHQVAVSGAGKGFNYYLSTSFNQNKGIVIGDDYTRISVLGKISADITSWLKVGVDASFSKRDYSGIAANIKAAEGLSPYGVVYRDDQNHLEKYPTTQGLAAWNPLWGVQDGTTEDKDVRHNYRLNTYASIDAPWIKGLNFRVNFQINSDQNLAGRFYHEGYFIAEGEGIERYAPSVVQGYLSKANGSLNTNSTYGYVWDNILSFKRAFGKHNIEGTIVATRDDSKYNIIYTTGSDFSANGNTVLGFWGLHKATVQKVDLYVNDKDINNNTIGGVEFSNIGYLGRVNYSFNKEYYLTGSYRRDGASRFGANNKWGNFGAVGFAWRISNESFLKSFEPLNDLKLKLSWGQNGNQGSGPYSTLSQIANGSTGGYRYEFADAQGKVRYGLLQTTIGNFDLGWEKTASWNTGFESSWFKNRLTVNLDAYFSKTTDEIFTRQIPVMTGFKTILTSLGQVNNQGIELSIRTVNIHTKNLYWNTELTYWRNRNEIVHLYGTDVNKDGKEDDDISNNLFIGKPLGAIYGYQQDGIVQASDTEYMALTGAAAGTPKYVDADGVRGITSADRTILGYESPNFSLNLSNSVGYKNFDLYVMISGIFGGNNYYQKSNTAAYMTSGTGGAGDNMTWKPYWTASNPNNVYPSATFSGDGRFLGLQSRGFVRIQDVSLSYTLDKQWLTMANLNSLKLFVSMKNIATFTNWFGGDPETGTPVLDNTFPVPSTFSIGANISF